MSESSDDSPITDLLHAWCQGDQKAFSQLMQWTRGRLSRMAASRLHGSETPTFGADDLMNEALMKLMCDPPQWQDRAHFFATVATAMRSVLVDHARARRTDKRGGAWSRVTYTLPGVGEESMIADLLTLNSLLQRLELQDARAARILDLTYFAGLKREDIAMVLDLSVPTVDRELRFSRAWLAAELDRNELEA